MSSYSFDSEEKSNGEDTESKTKNDDQEINLNLDLIKSISKTLTMILEENKYLKNYKEIIQKQSKMVFSAKIVPGISINDYLKRIQKYTNIEKNTLIISLILIDRFCEISKTILTYYNIHRILFSAILMSIKYNEDSFYDNKYYSQIAGVKVKELQILEYNFIKLLNCELYVSRELYDKYQVYLENFKFDEDDK